MDRLESMQIFARVVEMHSFGRAAESLSLPPSRVTRAVKELEAFLGVRLLQRTTRHISLTADGTLYYDHCRKLLAEIEAVESGFPGSAGRPRGRLRVDMTLSLARLVVLPSIKDFQSRFPDVELTLTVSDRTVELVQEGIDCVIRAGTPEDSPTLVAKRIGAFHWVTCASPEYLALHGTPKSLECGYLLCRQHFIIRKPCADCSRRQRLVAAKVVNMDVGADFDDLPCVADRLSEPVKRSPCGNSLQSDLVAERNHFPCMQCERFQALARGNVAQGYRNFVADAQLQHKLVTGTGCATLQIGPPSGLLLPPKWLMRLSEPPSPAKSTA